MGDNTISKTRQENDKLKDELASMRRKTATHTPAISSKTRQENDKLKDELASMHRKVPDAKTATHTPATSSKTLDAKTATDTPATSSKTRQENDKLKDELASMRRKVLDAKTATHTPATSSKTPDAKTARDTPATSSKTRQDNEKLKEEMESLRRKVAAKTATATPATSSKTRLQNKELQEEKDELQKQIDAMKTQARMSRERDIGNAVRAAQELDLAFLFDATKSMHRYMEVVKERIVEIVRGVAKTYPDSHIRVGFAFYRDYVSKEGHGSCDFTESFKDSRSTFVQALGDVKTMSGGDVPEDVFSGLQELATLSWKAANRVVYHIADAPCHGTRFHNSSIRDDYPEGDVKGRDIADLLQNLRVACKICSYTFLHINKATTAKMLSEFKKAAPDGHKWIHEDDFDDMDLDSIPRKVESACKASIAQTLGALRFGNPT